MNKDGQGYGGGGPGSETANIVFMHGVRPFAVFVPRGTVLLLLELGYVYHANDDPVVPS